MAFEPEPTPTAALKQTAAIPVFADGTPDLYGLGDQSYFSGVSTSAQGPAGNLHDAVNAETGTSYVSAESILHNLVNLSQTNPNAFANIQAEMYNANMYSSKPIFGQWTSKDGDALGEALRSYLAVQSAGQPISFEEWLTKTSMGGAAAGGPSGTTRAPLQLTSSATLDQYGNTEAQQELGRNLTTGEQGAFVNKFHGEEQSAYDGGSQNAGDPSAEAKNFIDTTNQAGVQTNLSASYAQKMLSMLGVQSS